MPVKQPFIIEKQLFEKLLLFLKGVVTCTVLFLPLVFLNLIQMTTFVVMPISKKLCWKINRSLAFFWWGLVVFWMEKVYTTQILFSGDTIEKHTNALILPNHQSMADTPPLLSLSWRTHSTGTLKFFVKDSIKWVPGPGWGMYLLGCPFLKRDWKKDQNSVMQTLSLFKEHNVPLWLISFLEGTRATDEKITKSALESQQRGLEPFTHHLYPKKAGIVATIQGLRSHVKEIYSVTIGYPDGIPSLWQLCMGAVPYIHLHIKTYRMEDIPQSDEAIFDWVVAVFREKDELMGSFAINRKFPSNYYPARWTL